MKKLLLVLSCALCLFVAVATVVTVVARLDFADEPFGVRKGMPLSALGSTSTIKPGLYMFTPKAPHPYFEAYLVSSSTTYGACAVMAITDNISISDDGSMLWSQFESMEAALKSKYGPSSSYYNKERLELMTFRTQEKGFQPVDGIESITLKAEIDSTYRGQLILNYEFDNSKGCRKEIEESANQSL